MNLRSKTISGKTLPFFYVLCSASYGITQFLAASCFEYYVIFQFKFFGLFCPAYFLNKTSSICGFLYHWLCSNDRGPHETDSPWASHTLKRSRNYPATLLIASMFFIVLIFILFWHQPQQIPSVSIFYFHDLLVQWISFVATLNSLVLIRRTLESIRVNCGLF